MKIGDPTIAAPATTGATPRLADRLWSMPAAVRRISPEAWGLIAIAAVVVVANVLYLSGVFDPNPLGTRSGLGSAVSPGTFLGQPTIDPNNGLVSQALGHAAVRDWFHLTMPWWNPNEATGTPLAGEMQSAALFPLTILTTFSNGQLFEHMLLELIAGVSTFLLMRRLSVGVVAATAAGIAFALNGTFAWLANAIVNPVAFLPLLLLGLEQAHAASLEARRGGWWLIPVAGALSFYAGFPEVSFINGLMAILWFAWRCLSLRGASTELKAFVGKAIAGGVVAAMLIGPLLIAFVDYLPHADTGIHSLSLSDGRLSTSGLPQFILPYVYGPIFAFSNPEGSLPLLWGGVGGYISTALVFFGLVGLVSRRLLGLRVVLSAWLLVSISHIYGQPPFLGHVLDVIPGLSHVVFSRYATSSVELTVIILAGLGLDDVISHRASRRWVLLAGGVSLVAVVVAALGATPLVHQLGAGNSHRYFSRLSVLWGAAIVVSGLLLALLRSSRLRTVLLAAVIAVDAIVLFLVPEFSAPRSVSTDLGPVTYLRQHLGTSRFYSLGPLGPNYGSYFGLASLNANDNPVPSKFSSYARAHLDPTVNATHFDGTAVGRYPGEPSAVQELVQHLAGYQAASVAYVVVPAEQPLPTDNGAFTRVFQSPTAWIYRVAKSQPYFTASDCTVTTTNRSDASVACTRDSVLVRRETSMPGWGAEVDGRSAAVHEVDGAFQGVEVGPGSHRVTFSFSPPGETFGLAALAIGLVWLIVGNVRDPGLRRRLRARPTV